MAIVGKWKLNEASGVDRVDLSGNSNTLTDVGGVATGTGHGGGANLAANFPLNGAKYLEITDVAQTGLDLGSIFSISFWYNPHAAIAAEIISKSVHVGDQRSFVMFQNGASALSVYFSILGTIYNTSITDTTYPFTVGTWYNIQIIVDGTNIKIYAGQKGGALTLVNTTAFSSSLFNSTAPFQVGKSILGNTANGIVDDLIIANHVFTEQERLDNFNAGDDFAPNTQILFDDNNYTIVKLTSLNVDETSSLKVDVSALSPSTTNVTIEKIQYNIEGMNVSLLWDATTDVKIVDLSGFGEFDFTEFGGLINNAGAGVTGDILLTTNGYSAGDSYSIILILRKL